IGKQITEVVSLDIGNSAMFVGSKLVVFVQNSNNKKVYQSVFSDLSGLTSMAPDNINNLVDIYPNPASERLIVDSRYKIRRLVITDITGRVIRILEPDQERIELSIENYKYGVYMIRGITGGGEFMKKFIKQ
ncbi:MAG: T9SS type A sorting domain-containing protein, partial [Bacteroidales bacterium]